MRAVLFAVLFCGIPVSVLGFLAVAALLTAADMPGFVYSISAALPVLTGCLSAGYFAGKQARRGGLRCGLLAAFLLTALWYAAARILFGRCRLLLLLLTLPCGMLGGVSGVNTKLPLPHRKLPAIRRIPLRLTFAHRIRQGVHRARRNTARVSPESDSSKPKNC